MGYSSTAVALFGYPIKIEDHQTKATKCPKSDTQCPLMSGNSSFCSKCGSPRDALHHVEDPSWIIDDEIYASQGKQVVGVYRRCYEPKWELFLGIIVGTSKSEHDLSSINIPEDAVQQIHAWMEKHGIKIEGEPKLYVHKYESY